MFGTANMINIPITMCTGLMIPFVYEYMGITTNYDILFYPDVRKWHCTVWLCSAILLYRQPPAMRVEREKAIATIEEKKTSFV